MVEFHRELLEEFLIKFLKHRMRELLGIKKKVLEEFLKRIRDAFLKELLEEFL